MNALPLIPYGRKSSGEDDELSRSRQSGAIQRWAESEGVALTPLVWEPHVSGKRSWRERGLGEVIAAVERGEAAGVVVEEQSRLSRENMRATAEVWEALEKAGARLVCTAEGIDTAKGDHELSFAIRAALAREQWKQYARRMSDMKARRIVDGIWIGPVPVGYRKRADKRLEVDPVTAPVVRELFERWAAGEGRSTLCRLLDEATGRTWSRQAIPAIISNRLYATGRIQYGDTVSEYDSGAIVDEALWHAAQKPRKSSGPRPSRSPDGPWLVTGLARCGSCGHSLSPTTTRGGTAKQYRYYRCPNRKCSAKRGASAPKLEQWTRDAAFRLIGSKLKEIERESVDLEPLRAAVSKAETRLEQALAPEAQDALGDRWIATVRERRAALDAALAELGEAQQASEPSTETLVDLEARWDDMTPAEQREAIARYAIEAVMVHGSVPSEWELVLR